MTRKENVNVRVDPDLVDELDAEAQARGLSRSEYLRWIIRNRDSRDVEEQLSEHEARITALEHAVAELRAGSGGD